MPDVWRTGGVVRLNRLLRVMGGLDRSFTGSVLEEEAAFLTEADLVSPLLLLGGGLVMLVRVEGGRKEVLFVAVEVVLNGRPDVAEPLDMVLLRGLMVGKRLGEVLISAVVVTAAGLSSRIRLDPSAGLRIDLVLVGAVDMVDL
jgi:hypothetical protein